MLCQLWRCTTQKYAVRSFLFCFFVLFLSSLFLFFFSHIKDTRYFPSFFSFFLLFFLPSFLYLPHLSFNFLSTFFPFFLLCFKELQSIWEKKKIHLQQHLPLPEILQVYHNLQLKIEHQVKQKTRKKKKTNKILFFL